MLDWGTQPSTDITLSLLSQMYTVNPKYAVDYREHAVTRIENDRTLSPKLGAIREGRDIEALERFAKAYLGMYLDIDNNIPPHDRIYILANETLADAIQHGFEAVLVQSQFPDEVCIAEAMMNEQPLAIGYILLAALDLFGDDPRYAIAKLPSLTLRTAICFHYAAKTELQDKWFTQVLQQRPDDVADALSVFWQHLITRDCDHLPGLYQIISHRQYDNISRRVLLPVLAKLQRCHKRILRDLLHAALRITNLTELFRLCETALSYWNSADPSRYILWLTTAFLLQPGKYGMLLADYCGRSKEKILPLLDFVVMVLLTDDEQRLPLHGDSYAQLLRIIAAKFAPQMDRYDNPCDNTQKVIYLFYRLAMATDADADFAIRQLSQVRVMKLYKDILTFITALRTRSQTLEFEEFLARLQAENSIKSRKKWSDQSH